MRLYTVLAVTTLLACAPTVMAQHAHAAHDPHAGHGTPAAVAPASKHAAAFKQLDKNSDGFIVRSELPSTHPLLPHFAMSDRNRDGKLDAKEFDAGMSML